MTIVFEDTSPNKFLEPLGGKIQCNGFVSYDWRHVSRVFQGNFVLDMFGGLVLSRKYRWSSEAETVLPSDVKEVQASTIYHGNSVKITWITSQQKFTVEE